MRAIHRSTAYPLWVRTAACMAMVACGPCVLIAIVMGAVVPWQTSLVSTLLSLRGLDVLVGHRSSGLKWLAITVPGLIVSVRNAIRDHTSA